MLSNEALLSQLELHQCDIGLGFDEPAGGAGRRAFHVYPQGANQMAVLMNRDEADQYPHSGDIALAELQQQPLVLPSRTMQFRQYLDRAAEQGGTSLNVVLETDSLFHLVSAVRHRLGWAIVSAGLARSASKLSDLVCLPLAPLENIGHTAFLTRQQSITPAMRAFLELVAEGEPANAP